jgi:hypothetical protein
VTRRWRTSFWCTPSSGSCRVLRMVRVAARECRPFPAFLTCARVALTRRRRTTSLRTPSHGGRRLRVRTPNRQEGLRLAVASSTAEVVDQTVLGHRFEAVRLPAVGATDQCRPGRRPPRRANSRMRPILCCSEEVLAGTTGRRLARRRVSSQGVPVRLPRGRAVHV